ncbi:MAG: hypothetical protein JOZ07_01415 [Solirubrobacterales bacterium]|nr:hypothetical protein [Solirubrobacterales bacterium]
MERTASGPGLGDAVVTWRQRGSLPATVRAGPASALCVAPALAAEDFGKVMGALAARLHV